VVIFGAFNQVLYSSLDDFEVNATPELLDRIRREGKIEYTHNNYEHLGMLFADPKGDVVVIASAYDRYGRSKLANLRTLLISGLIIGLILIFIAGNIFAEQAMAPLARLNSEVSSITAGNLSQRVDEGNRHDEIAQLAMNFNAMLERLEAAFAIQQQFVSNASHELRTPLAALSGQLQATLEKQRTPEEYRKVLKSLSEDTRELVGLTNGLLTLAQSPLFQCGAGG
jgi:two-component system, OmpR family, sensor histidine kinase ArlS